MTSYFRQNNTFNLLTCLSLETRSQTFQPPQMPLGGRVRDSCQAERFVVRQRMKDSLLPTGKRASKQSTRARKEKQKAKKAEKPGTRASKRVIIILKNGLANCMKRGDNRIGKAGNHTATAVSK